jgi:hypothetical protein
MDWPSRAPAWLAVAVAALALLRNVLSDRARRRDNRANEEWREAQESELRATRRDWTEAFKRMADALERRDASQAGTAPHAPTPADLHAQGAQLSARLSSVKRPDDRLVVMNLGPGGAQLREVKVTNDPGALVEPTGVSPGDPVELVAGEEYTMPLAISMATPMPIEVWLQWRDGTNQIKERMQKLM